MASTLSMLQSTSHLNSLEEVIDYMAKQDLNLKNLASGKSYTSMRFTDMHITRVTTRHDYAL